MRAATALFLLFLPFVTAAQTYMCNGILELNKNTGVNNKIAGNIKIEVNKADKFVKIYWLDYEKSNRYTIHSDDPEAFMVQNDLNGQILFLTFDDKYIDFYPVTPDPSKQTHLYFLLSR